MGKPRFSKAQRGDRVPLVEGGRFVARDVMLSVTPETALFVGGLLSCLIVCSLLFCARRNCEKTNAEGVIAKSIDDLSDECNTESEDDDEYESTPEPKAEHKELV